MTLKLQQKICARVEILPFPFLCFTEFSTGAQLMNNIAELIVRGDPTTERQKYAESWAQKALSILQTTRKNTKEPIPTCELALSVALFNAGMLREVYASKSPMFLPDS
jgi:hypothetical protein